MKNEKLLIALKSEYLFTRCVDAVDVSSGKVCQSQCKCWLYTAVSGRRILCSKLFKIVKLGQNQVENFFLSPVGHGTDLVPSAGCLLW